MNPNDALLSLVAELQAAKLALQAENAQLRQQIEAMKAAPPSAPEGGGDGRV